MRDLSYRHNPAPRRKNRIKKERKPVNWRGLFRKMVRYASGALLAGSVAGLGYGLYVMISRTSFTLLPLQKVEVVNSKRLSKEEVLELAGVKPGAGMFSLNLKVIAEQVAKNPWVEEVKVRRFYPGTLSVKLTEREPLAVVNMNYLYYLDKKGEVFKPLTQGDSLDYPVITGLSEEELGKDPNGSREALKGAVELISLMQRGGVIGLADISEIHVGKGYGITLFTANGGVPVKLGEGGYAEKLERLAKIFKDIQGQMASLEYIDLNYSDKIIVKKV